VILAEDSVLLREGLVRLLAEAGHQVVAAVGDAPALIRAVEQVPADLVITDVRMPPGGTDDGLRAAIQIRAAHPVLPVLVLSQYVERSYARDLLADASGGVGYLLKDRIQDLDDFSSAIDRVLGGGTVIDPEVVAQLLTARRSGDSALDRLTARETEVLGLVAEGLSNQAIGEKLFITLGAVEKHIATIFAKLDLPPDATANRRVQAVLRWLQH
jgi:DNA-binding NarL/FixJ family response regulator